MNATTNLSFRSEMREANHRAMNTLSILLSLLRRGFSKFEDQGVQEAVLQFETQIIALRDLQGILTIGTGDQVVSADSYIENLCKSLSDGLLTPHGIQCRASIEQGFLPACVCERLGLIIVELVTNAAK